MADYDVVIKGVEEVWAAVLSEEVADVTEIGQAHGRLWPRIHAALDALGIDRAGPSLAIEAPHADLTGLIHLTAAVPIADGTLVDIDGITSGVIPACKRAAVTVITGDPKFDGPDFHGGWNALQYWLKMSTETGTGEFRELYLDCDGPRLTWVVEVQMMLA